MRFPVNVLLQLCLYLAQLTRYCHLFPKLCVGHVTQHTSFSGVIYHACNSTPMYQLAQEIWSAYSFTDSKDMIGAKLKNWVTWLWPRPLESSRSSTAKHLIYSTYVQNLATVDSVIPVIWWFAILGLALGTFNLLTKFEVSIFTHYENKKGDTKCRNGVVRGCQGHTMPPEIALIDTSHFLISVS